MRIRFRELYYFLLFLAFLPSGSIFGLPIKDGIVLMLLVYCILKNKLLLGKPIKGILLSISMMFPWGMLSIYNGYEDGAYSFIKSFLPFFLVLLITYIYIQNGWMDYDKALRSLKFAALIHFGVKIIVEIFLLSHIINYSSIFYIFEEVFNTRWMPMEGLLNIYRITTPNDSLPLIVIGLLIFTENKMTLLNKYVMLLLGCFYVAITFSRILIIEYAVIVLLSFMICFFENQNVKGFISFIMFFTFLVGIIVYAISNDSIMQLINVRFKTTYATYSDYFRDLQFGYLSDGFSNSPLIGYGLGAYVKQCIRSYESVHSYELEWFSIFYQLGIIGFLFIMGPLIYSLYISIFKGIENKYIKVYLIAVFLIWLAKPLYNPNLFSSHSAMLITLLIIISYVYGEKTVK